VLNGWALCAPRSVQLRNHDFQLLSGTAVMAVDCVQFLQCKQLATYHCEDCGYGFCYGCYEEFHSRCCGAVCFHSLLCLPSHRSRSGACGTRLAAVWHVPWILRRGSWSRCGGVPVGVRTVCCGVLVPLHSGAYKRHTHMVFPAGSPVCDLCGSHVASLHCTTCADSLCAACMASTHSKGRRREHTYTQLPGMEQRTVFIKGAAPPLVPGGANAAYDYDYDFAANTAEQGAGAGVSESKRGEEDGVSNFGGY
jgi:hypothetical protein